jgi:antitoxin component YwqK of YwqJK toxin-antitoxin module
MSTSVTTITKALSTITTRLETNPNSLVEYVTTLTTETKEDGTEVKLESTKEYVLEEINKHGEHKWYNRDGQLHRNGDLPALIDKDGNQCWYKDGKLHRDGELPAVIYADGTQHWYKDGKLHRDGDLPAIICANDNKYWYKEGKLHRDGDLPAAIYANGEQLWFKEGKQHRDRDLPAVIYADGTKSWYKNGINYKPSFPKISTDKLLAALESLQLGLAELTKELTSH